MKGMRLVVSTLAALCLLGSVAWVSAASSPDAPDFASLGDLLIVDYDVVRPTATDTPTATRTPTRTNTPTPTSIPTRATNTPTASPSVSPTPTGIPTRATNTPSPTPTTSPSATPSATSTRTHTPSPTTSASPSATPSATLTPSVTRVTLTPAPTRTPTLTPTRTRTATRPPTSIPTYTPTKTATPVTLDLSVMWLELTQSIQGEGNPVDLIAEKRTYVRAHVKSNWGSWPGVKGEFKFAHSTVLGTGWLPADNWSRSITVKPNPDRGEVNDSFYIEVPPSLLVEGTLYVIFRMNGDHNPPETDYDNNDASIQRPLYSSPKLRVRVFNVRYLASGIPYQASFSEAQGFVSWLSRAFPVAAAQWSYQTLHWTPTITPALAGCMAVNNLLVVIRWMDSSPHEWRYYGMVTDEGGYMRGCAPEVPSYVASGATGDYSWGWDYDGSYGDWLGAHELGHNYNCVHVFCNGDEQGIDVFYPYPGGRIGGTSENPDRFYGWDTRDRVAYGPNWKDLMTYCRHRWISSYTYAQIRERLIAEAVFSGLSARTAEAVEYLVVMGSANLTQGTAELGTLLRWESTVPPEPPKPSADWVLALRDGGGGTLASYRFTPHADIEALAGEEVRAAISEIVPWVNGTERIIVLRQGVEVAARTVSAHAPTVQVLYPNGGETLSGATVTVTWNGSDQDGDLLHYVLGYSTDAGQTWQTLTDYASEKQLAVPLADLPGSTTALFRVIASDGVNTAVDVSDAVFAVAGHVPQAWIESPESGSRYAPGQQVMLVGEGYDLEDGQLLGSGLSWSSDLQGDLGTGAQVARTDLLQGTHVITLRATDSDGQSGVATVTISVGMAQTAVYLPVVRRGR